MNTAAGVQNTNLADPPQIERRRVRTDWIGRCLRDDRANAIVETALMLPLVLLIMGVILQVGLVMNQAISLTQAATSGAQALQTADSASLDDPCAVAFAAVTAAAPTLNQDNIVMNITLDSNAHSGHTCAGTKSEITPTHPISIELQYPYKFSLIGYGTTTFSGVTVYSGNMSSGVISEIAY